MTTIDNNQAEAMLAAAFATDHQSNEGSNETGAATGGDPPPGVPARPGYRYLVPFAEAADDFAAQAKTLTTGERIYTGLPQFDDAMRGLGPKQLMIVQGYAHSGKTVFVTEMMRHNHEARMVLFTADEDRVLMLTKLASLVHGVSAEELERRIANGDTEAMAMVRSTATDHFPNLAVFDNVTTIDTMRRCLDECRDHWGGKEQLTVFDYANLLQYDGDVVAKIDALKGFGKDTGTPLCVMHQSSRTKGSDGAYVGIDSGSHGGEQQATFLVGVRRKKNQYGGMVRELQDKLQFASRNKEIIQDQLTEAEWELERHQNTLTINLVKNKRPPGHLVDDVDFTLDQHTGRIQECDMPFVARGNERQYGAAAHMPPPPPPDTDNYGPDDEGMF